MVADPGCIPFSFSWSDASVRLSAQSLRKHHGHELLFTSSKVESRYEAVTLLEKIINMVVEQPMFFSETDGARFRGMRLEDLDEQYFNVNLDDDDFSHADQHHQAEAVNITLVDNYESGLAETDMFNRFERFDIADDETIVNITPDEHPQVPSTLVPSPPRQEDPPRKKNSTMVPPPLFMKILNKGDQRSKRSRR